MMRPSARLLTGAAGGGGGGGGGGGAVAVEAAALATAGSGAFSRTWADCTGECRSELLKFGV